MRAAFMCVSMLSADSTDRKTQAVVTSRPLGNDTKVNERGRVGKSCRRRHPHSPAGRSMCATVYIGTVASCCFSSRPSLRSTVKIVGRSSKLGADGGAGGGGGRHLGIH